MGRQLRRPNHCQILTDSPIVWQFVAQWAGPFRELRTTGKTAWFAGLGNSILTHSAKRDTNNTGSAKSSRKRSFAPPFRRDCSVATAAR